MFRHLRAGRGWELDRLTRAQLTVPEGEPEPDTALVGQGLGDVHEFAHARPIFRPDAKYRSTRLGGRQCFPKPMARAWRGPTRPLRTAGTPRVNQPVGRGVCKLVCGRGMLSPRVYGDVWKKGSSSSSFRCQSSPQGWITSSPGWIRVPAPRGASRPSPRRGPRTSFRSRVEEEFRSQTWEHAGSWP